MTLTTVDGTWTGTSRVTGNHLSERQSKTVNQQEEFANTIASAYPVTDSSDNLGIKAQDHAAYNDELSRFEPGNTTRNTIEDMTYDGEDGEGSVDSRFTETTSVPRRKLGFVQAVSLMLNTTIGTGIFTTPGYVLALTRSKRISLVLWAVGGVYSALR